MLSIWKLLMVFLLMVSVIDMLYPDKSGSSTHDKRGTFPAIRYFMHGFRKHCAKTSATVGDHHLMTLCFRQPPFDSQLTHWPCFSSMVWPQEPWSANIFIKLSKNYVYPLTGLFTPWSSQPHSADVIQTSYDYIIKPLDIPILPSGICLAPQVWLRNYSDAIKEKPP